MKFSSAKATASELSNDSGITPYPRAYVFSSDGGIIAKHDNIPEGARLVIKGHEREAHEAYENIHKWHNARYKVYFARGWSFSVFTAMALSVAIFGVIDLVSNGLMAGNLSIANFFFLFPAAGLFSVNLRVSRNISVKSWRGFVKHLRKPWFLTDGGSFDEDEER